jgi:hypothetical protein
VCAGDVAAGLAGLGLSPEPALSGSYFLHLVDRARAAADGRADERALLAADERADAGTRAARAADHDRALLPRARGLRSTTCGRASTTRRRATVPS